MAKLFSQKSTHGPQAPLQHMRSTVTSTPLLSALALIATVLFAILAFFAHTLASFPVDLPITQVERLGFGALIVLIGISRIYQGEHWASDVLAGYLLGFVGLMLMIWLYRWAQAHFGNRTD